MPFESPEDMQKRVKEEVNNLFDPNFEKKYEAVKPALELFEKTGYTSEQQRVNAEERAKLAERKKDDAKAIQAIRASLGLEPQLESDEHSTNEESSEDVHPNYTEVRNDKTGRSILFPKESIINNEAQAEDRKYVEIKNENTGRSILFSKEDIENAKKQSSIEDMLKVPNELANSLKKEQQLLSTIENEITKTQTYLENFNNPQYVDRLIDQYENSAKAGEELRFEFESLTEKLGNLKEAAAKTNEAIGVIERKLSQ